MQVPTFFNRQVLVKVVPGAKTVPSGTVTSATNSALSHVDEGSVTVIVPGVFVAVAVKVGVGGVTVPVFVEVGLGGVPVAVAVAVEVFVGVTDVPETLISTHQGLLANAPIPNKAPLAFLNIQYPR